jgi:N-methylhydantoinase A
LRITHELRYRGQSFELSIEESAPVDPAALREAFARAHESRYGYRDDDAAIELVNMRASVWGDAPPLRPLAGGRGDTTTGSAPIVFDGAAVTAIVARGELAPGTHLNGPALYALPDSTLLLPPGWSGTVDANGTCRLQAQAGPDG